MSFTIYKGGKTGNTPTVWDGNETNGSPASKRYFEITMTEGSDNGMANLYNLVTKFTGITDEIPEIGYSTTWGSGPTAILADKIKNFTNNDLIKTFAAGTKFKGSGHNYRPIIATDSWTQLYPKDGSLITIPLKFRAYPFEMNRTSPYFDIIKLLTYCTSPKSFKFSDPINMAKQAVETAYDTGFDLGQAIRDVWDNFKKVSKQEIDWKDISEILVKTHDIHTDDDMSDLADVIGTKYSNNAPLKALVAGLSAITYVLDSFDMTTYSAGTPTFKLCLGTDIIEANSYSKWCISSWSFKPSINTTVHNDTICPIYIDISLTLRTQGKFTNSDLLKLFGFKVK